MNNQPIPTLPEQAPRQAVIHEESSDDFEFVDIVHLTREGVLIESDGVLRAVGTIVKLLFDSGPPRPLPLRAVVVEHIREQRSRTRTKLQFVVPSLKLHCLEKALEQDRAHTTLMPRISLGELVGAVSEGRESFVRRFPYGYLAILGPDGVLPPSGAMPASQTLMPLYNRSGACEGTLVLGRDPECDLVISDVRISRRHARFLRSPQNHCYLVSDMGSRNGTVVDHVGVSVGQMRIASPGALVVFGSFACVLLTHELVYDSARRLCTLHVVGDDRGHRTEPGGTPLAFAGLNGSGQDRVRVV